MLETIYSLNKRGKDITMNVCVQNRKVLKFYKEKYIKYCRRWFVARIAEYIVYDIMKKKVLLYQYRYNEVFIESREVCYIEKELE